MKNCDTCRWHKPSTICWQGHHRDTENGWYMENCHAWEEHTNKEEQCPYCRITRVYYQVEPDSYDEPWLNSREPEYCFICGGKLA